MRARRHAVRSEQGAVFVQVGISLFVLMAFNVFVLDYGMMWIARGQAQNAADAGALAGAIGRAYDERVISSVAISQSARDVALASLVWQQPATATATLSCPAGVTGRCVRVDVFRNGENGSTSLPTLFGPILGVATQGVRATATGIVGGANTTTCLKPWALPDRWTDIPAPANEFNAWSGGVPLSPADSYTRPDGTQAVSTNISANYGDFVRFDLNFPLAHAISYPLSGPVPAFALPLTLPGSNTHFQNMTGCNGQPISIGQRLPVDLAVIGGGSGGIADVAAHAAYNLDLGADWAFEAGGYVEGSCAPGCAPHSPRLWAVALYDPSDFDKNRTMVPPWQDCPGGQPCVLIANITGFFIDYLWPTASPNGQHGHYVPYPGTTAPLVAPPIIDNGSWLVEPRLIR